MESEDSCFITPESEAGEAQFFMIVDDITHSFNASWIPVEKHKWFVNIMTNLGERIKYRATLLEHQRLKRLFDSFVNEFI